MRSIIVKISIVLLSVIAICVIMVINRKHSDGKLTLKKDLKEIAANDSIIFKGDPFKRKVKVVTYIVDEYGLVEEIQNWKRYIEKYPEIGFIFYVKGNNELQIKEMLRKIKLSIPVFLDPDADYGDNLLISYVLDEDNHKVAVTNPSIPGYSDFLEKCLKK